MKEKIGYTLMVLNFVAFFVPVIKELFLVQVPLGLLPLTGMVVWLSLSRLKKPVCPTEGAQESALSQTQGEHPVATWKNERIEFPLEKVCYSIEYPTDKEDVATWLRSSFPRCLDHHSFYEAAKAVVHRGVARKHPLESHGGGNSTKVLLTIGVQRA